MPVLKKGSADGPKKKAKGTKKKRKDTSLLEDVPTHTSLPPKVDGQLRCYLRVSINQILWNVPNAPDFTQVQLLWWGEEGKGSLFRPVDVKRGEKRGPMHYTVARYPIRAGPKQLASYFNDMESLTLDILSGPNQVVVGRTQIDQISFLTPNSPINGFYPVFSADQEKVAELQVSVVLESLMSSYDNLSSVPTPDMSFQTRESFNEAQPVNPPRIVHTPAPLPVYSATDDPFRSPTANKFQSRIEKSVPKGVDSLIYGVNGQSVHDSSRSYPVSGPSDQPSFDDIRQSASSATQSKERVDSRVQDQPHQSHILGNREKDSSHKTYATLADITNRGGIGNLLGTDSSGGRDLVSELLERGQKLREAMIVSTLDEGITDQKPFDTGLAAVTPVFDKAQPSGQFFNEILLKMDDPEKLKPKQLAHTSVEPSNRFAIGRGFGSVGVGVRGGGYDVLSTSETSDTEDKAIDLILGPDGDVSQYELMKDFGASPTGSISGGDDVNSDPGDPIYDDVLLRELFYRNPETEESDISLSECEPETKPLKEQDRSDSVAESLNEPGNMRPPSRSGSRRSSSSSIILDLEPTRDTDAISLKSSGKKKRKKKKKTQKLTESESDMLSTSRVSESSRVSFDPVPSDMEEPDPDTSKSKKNGADGLSVERLTLLGRVHMARVMIDNLSLSFFHQTQPTKTTPRSKSGKPPRPVKKASTYFIEYQFPVVATSRDKYSPNAMATEVMRVASKKVNDGLVTFGHRSVFPILFDGEAIDKWWQSALVFKVYSRAPSQKVPTLLGMCSVPLKSVLKADALYLERSLEVKDRSASSSGSSTSLNRSKQTGSVSVGFVKLVIELASDSKDFAKALAKTRLAEMTNPRMVALPQTPKPRNAPSVENREQHTKGDVQTSAGTQTEPRPVNLDTAPLAPPNIPSQVLPSASEAAQATVQRRACGQPAVTPLDAYTNTMDKEEALTLHALLMVPEGENISLQGVHLPSHGEKEPSVPPRPLTGWMGRDTATRNLYLSVRMFWCDDTSRSDVCWGTIDPVFKFMQVVPVLLTTSFLERLRNNFVVVEVWDKKTSSESDQLVGIIKLPLHQFYMSYRDRRIAASLYKSQYPVVSIDTSMPIVNPFTGSTHGQLKVLLAMGSAQQVSALQSLKGDNGTVAVVPERPLHYLERQHLGGTTVPGQEYNSENVVDHMFEVSVEGVRGLRLLETMIWGEADCFVQYHFPSQTQIQPNTGPAVIHAGLSLKTFRTATTLCIPDPVFNDVLQHKVTMPEGTPVQREILTACAGAGGGSGGVPLEVWCRYYYPNTRDQVIAKAVLPLAKLCAMVTMKRHGEPNVQAFSLPLSPVGADPDDGTGVEPGDSGLLDIAITYKTQTHKAESKSSTAAVSRTLPGAQVCIAVSILRASALKAAVLRAAGQDAGMQYAAEVGSNAYVRVNMSFLQKQDERITRTVARSFAPEFSYHMDFPVPLLWTELDCDALSLAEILDSAEVTFEIWHETPSSKFDVGEMYRSSPDREVKGRCLVPHSGDVLLGTTTIPLLGLLKQATGIRGWFAVNAPSTTWDRTEKDQSEPHRQRADTHGQCGLERVVGGLEISLRFAHEEDRERVLHAGRGVGWAPSFEVEARDWEDADELAACFSDIIVSVDFVCCPLASALIPGQTRLDPSASIYIRYKFYDRNAVCSKTAVVSVNDEDYVTCDLRHSKTLVIPSSGPFFWYLNEERLEIQVWLTYSGGRERSNSSRPRNRDKLLGSAYLQLDALAERRRHQHRISGVYPLFKPGSANLGGACVRAHVTLKPHTSDVGSESEESEGHYQVEDAKSPPRKSSSKVSPASPSPPVDIANTFSAYVSIERALHLPPMTYKESEFRQTPSCYVSYQTAEQDKPICTEVVLSDESPTWSFNRQTRLHKELLTDDSKNLVFKVWHKPDGGRSEPDKTTDRVVGFVSVDLSPLMAGFSQISGWYNIMDFNGICQGQIKIAVTPHESMTQLTNIAHQVDSKCSLINQGLPRLPSQIITGSSHLDAASLGVLSRFSQHYENVKHYHESLASQLVAQKQESFPQVHPEVSRSALFRSLRSNIADLDNITGQLKTRLQTVPYPAAQGVVSIQENLNHTGHSTQPETETSALTNSQQFLLLPTEVPTSGTDTEIRTLEGTKASAFSTALASIHTVDLNLNTGTSTLLSRMPKDAGLLHEKVAHSQDHAHDPILARGPLLHEEAPFGSYHQPAPHHVSDDEASQDEAEGDNGDYGADSHQHIEYNTDDDVGGEVIVPRALNDISNVNFNNMLSQVFLPDNTGKISEEDSWFASTSPQRANHLQYTLETVTDEQYHESADQSDKKCTTGTGLTETGISLGDTVTTLADTLALTAGTVQSFGGTVTSLGTVNEDDPYGRTLIGGVFNRATKINLNFNYDDSWATNNASVVDDADKSGDEKEVNQKEVLEESTGGKMSSKPEVPVSQVIGDDLEDEILEKSVLSPEEKSVVMEEDPLSFSSVSRTTLSESNSSKVNKARKAAMYRREYDRHRNGDSSSSSSDNECGSRTNGRRRSSQPRSRASPNKKRNERIESVLNDVQTLDNAESRVPEITNGSEHEVHNNHTDDDTLVKDGDTGDPSPRSELSANFTDQVDVHVEDQTIPSEALPSDQELSGSALKETETSRDEVNDSLSKQSISKSSAASVPNFFLPSSDLEQSMRALRAATLDKSGFSSLGDQSGGSARSLLSGRFAGTSSAKTKPLPDSKQTQRIAKIFAAKLSS